MIHLVSHDHAVYCMDIQQRGLGMKNAPDWGRDMQKNGGHR
jgi:hypothetical protein